MPSSPHIETITSLQNPGIKNILKLEKLSERRSQHLFVLEGVQELNHALDAGIEIKQLYFCPDIVSPEQSGIRHDNWPGTARIFAVSRPVYEKIAYRGGTEGVVALAVPRSHAPAILNLPDNPLVLILESVEKPGNLGAVLRTADGAGVDAVLVCDPHTDLYNPNVIRSSVGCLFTVQTAIGTGPEVMEFLRAKGIRIFAAALPAVSFYHQTDFTGPSAIVLGTESTGLSPFWLQHADQQVKIPMLGKNDSLNVSVSAAVFAYEAKRQRGFRKVS